MNEFIFYDYVYTENEITYLQNLCSSVNWERLGGFTDADDDGNRYISSPEKYLDPDKLIKTYLNFLPEYASNCLSDGFIASKGYTPDVKLSKYQKGDQYDWHCDYWEFHEQTQYWKRQISSITYLNDNYEGGETEFECGIIIKPQMGKTVIFPSTWCFPHRGTIVTKGIKYIYVKHIWA